jgi:hypothetical protein
MPNPNENLQGRFCALEYRPQAQVSGSLKPPTIIVLVLKDENGKLRFLVHAQLCSIVTGADISYIQSLLDDFVERATLHPAELFKQLSSLGVGPLVTKETGSSILDKPSLLDICSRFRCL